MRPALEAPDVVDEPGLGRLEPGQGLDAKRQRRLRSPDEMMVPWSDCDNDQLAPSGDDYQPSQHARSESPAPAASSSRAAPHCTFERHPPVRTDGGGTKSRIDRLESQLASEQALGREILTAAETPLGALANAFED